MMNVQAIDKEQLKSAVWELMRENKDFLKEIITEMINEKALEAENRDEKISRLIREDISKYRKVWETLA